MDTLDRLRVTIKAGKKEKTLEHEGAAIEFLKKKDLLNRTNEMIVREE